MIWFWYNILGINATNVLAVKMLELKNNIQGTYDYSSVIILSATNVGNTDDLMSPLQDFSENMATSITTLFH